MSYRKLTFAVSLMAAVLWAAGGAAEVFEIPASQAAMVTVDANGLPVGLDSVAAAGGKCHARSTGGESAITSREQHFITTAAKPNHDRHISCHT